MLPGLAQDPPPADGGRNNRGPRRPSEDMLKKYDKDGDGKLSEDEMKAMREAREKEMLEKYDADKDRKLNEEERKKMEAENPRRGGGFFQPSPEILKKYDKNGDGKLDDDERKAWRDDREKEMLEKYDADKDGKLSESERQTASAAMRKELNANPTAKPDAAKKPEVVKPEAK